MGFLVYKRFYDPARADALIEILTDSGIAHELTEDKGNLDLLYGDKNFGKQYIVKINGEDFKKADAILLSLSENELDTISKDHYLYDFSDDELLDVVSKSDEWSELDFQLAKKILKERGKEISEESIDLLKTQRLNDLAKPEERPKNWIYAGYIFALLGGLFAVFIGWHLVAYKKILPSGEQVYGYKPLDRKHGKRILILGSIMFVVWMVIRLSTFND